MVKDQKVVSNLHQKEKLDQFAVNIEFLLISVVQGVALAALATSASQIVGEGKFEYLLYVISGFLFILNFWSQAIIHTVSFIDWPLDMTHNFLYFLVSLVEVMAFSYLTDPLKWFEFICLFFIVAAILYFFDLSLIKKHKESKEYPEKKQLFDHTYKREKFEFMVFLPLGFLFNALSFFLILQNRNFFINNHLHILLIALQVIFGLFFLTDSVRNFKKRSELITKSELSESA